MSDWIEWPGKLGFYYVRFPDGRIAIAEKAGIHYIRFSNSENVKTQASSKEQGLVYAPIPDPPPLKEDDYEVKVSFTVKARNFETAKEIVKDQINVEETNSVIGWFFGE